MPFGNRSREIQPRRFTTTPTKEHYPQRYFFNTFANNSNSNNNNNNNNNNNLFYKFGLHEGLVPQIATKLVEAGQDEHENIKEKKLH